MLTYNGLQFAKKAGTKTYKPHIFDVVCHRYGLANEALHPWTNGQVKRMNRTIKEVTTRAFHCTSLEQLQSHLKNYLWAYNSARPLRALKGKTPIEFILEKWQKEIERFYGDPNPHFTGPNS
ncbi:integrase core domain-containing protein [Halomonas sp. IOP_14]|uniref:integrase core domain-containing protein n=1 Tax=Halomonas sp. IOP_14 TaxID=2873295 RepID=UPI001E2B32A5|nr:integrase core domain-containing protein [Halomonas sp. IOP_14]MCD1585056.1 integrase core domain-containing protein [Halomonas sp. IOP_14]